MYGLSCHRNLSPEVNMQVLQILVESDKKQSSPGRGFMFTVMKQLLNEIHLCLELVNSCGSIICITSLFWSDKV